MTLQSRLASAILAASALAPLSPALAQDDPPHYSTGALVGNVTYKLIDLAPDDGIDPWIGLNTYSIDAYAHVYDQQGNHIDGFDTGALGTASFANGYAAAWTQLREDGVQAGLELFSGYGYASANKDFRFTLAPHTEVTFSADATLWALHGVVPEHDTVTAIAELFGSLRGAGDEDGVPFSTRLQIAQDNSAGTLSLSVRSGDDWALGHVTISAYGLAESHALPVPEPAMPAMLLGGMGLLAVAGRRYRA